MQDLVFEEGKTYVDRDGTRYVFVDRRHGVTIFKDLVEGKNHVKNLRGQYRWDDKEDPRDIIEVDNNSPE